MLLLVFQLGDDRYALDARHVIEVVPLLALKKIPLAPRAVAGMFLYRGQPVPALDLCEAATGQAARAYHSTRIIIIQYTAVPGGKDRLLGLIAERATTTLRHEGDHFMDPGVKFKTTPYLGPVISDPRGLIQLLQVQKLLEEKVGDLVFTQPAE